MRHLTTDHLLFAAINNFCMPHQDDLQTNLEGRKMPRVVLKCLMKVGCKFIETVKEKLLLTALLF